MDTFNLIQAFLMCLLINDAFAQEPRCDCRCDYDERVMDKLFRNKIKLEEFAERLDNYDAALNSFQSTRDEILINVKEYIQTLISNSTDGGWSDWTTWNMCAVTCGVSMVTRSRSCDNPVPNMFGRQCVGNDQEGKTCDMGSCHVSVTGQWSDWTMWSECSATCDQGQTARSRSCTNPSPQGGGMNCTGSSYQTTSCMMTSCKYPADCSEIFQTGNGNTSGIYNITTWSSNTTTEVLCEMNALGGWTVFQYRFNGSVDFYRNFSSYENGFGSVHGEFWMGLRLLHEMTSRTTNELRWEMTAMDNVNSFDQYANFAVLTGSTYRLQVGSRINSSGVKSGTALPNHNGQAFTTHDRDQDLYSSGNCAPHYHSAFWYRSCYSAIINPNGLFGSTDSRMGMVYQYLAGNSFLTTSKMMFRVI